MRRFAVIGLGRFGFHVAKALFDHGNEVLAMDSERTRVQAADPHCTEALVVEATNRESLATLGLDSMDAVIVSTGTKIATSILLCQYLVELGVKRIMVKAVDDDHATILRRLGATDVIFPERDVAMRIALGLSKTNVLDFIPLARDFELVQVESPAEFVGKSLLDLNLRSTYNVQVIAIKELSPESFVLAPPAGYVIRKNDILVLLGKVEDIQKIRAMH